jgi:hypothetical protein
MHISSFCKYTHYHTSTLPQPPHHNPTHHPAAHTTTMDTTSIILVVSLRVHTSTIHTSSMRSDPCAVAKPLSSAPVQPPSHPATQPPNQATQTATLAAQLPSCPCLLSEARSAGWPGASSCGGWLGGALGRLLAGRARRPMLVVEGEVWEMKLLDIVLNMFVIP